MAPISVVDVGTFTTGEREGGGHQREEEGIIMRGRKGGREGGREGEKETE